MKNLKITQDDIYQAIFEMFEAGEFEKVKFAINQLSDDHKKAFSLWVPIQDPDYYLKPTTRLLQFMITNQIEREAQLLAALKMADAKINKIPVYENGEELRGGEIFKRIRQTIKSIEK